MKKLKKNLTLACIAGLVLALTACGGKKATTDEGFVIDLSDAIAADSGIVTVEAICDNIVIAAVDIIQTKGKLILPTTLSDNCEMMNTENSGGVVSDVSAKLAFLSGIYALNSAGETIGEFVWRDVNSKEIYSHIIYFDKDCDIIGFTEGWDINCYFKKGWNIRYDTANEEASEGALITTEPTGNFRWIYKATGEYW